MTTLIYHAESGGRWRVTVGQAVTHGTEIAAGIIRQHAARSGIVTLRDEHRLEIAVQGESVEPTWQRLDCETTTARQILERIELAGISGLGGGGFPTHLKLAQAARNRVGRIVVNAIECEPGISCDAALVQQSPQEIVEGISTLAHLLNAELHLAMSSQTSQLNSLPSWQRHELGDAYTPLGAERYLCQALFDEDIKAPARPTDHGIVVVNLATAHAIGRAMRGWPLTARMVTVHDANLWLPIGTPLATLVDADDCVVGGKLSGNPCNTNAGLKKTTNAVHRAISRSELPCIRCGACDDVCPELLGVTAIVTRPAADADTLQRLQADRCIECGLCSPVCPSGIDVLARARHAKYQHIAHQNSTTEARLSKARYQAHTQRVADRTRAKRERRAKRLEQRVRG